MKITILGTGNMARGIATRFLSGGNDVTLLGTSQDKAEALAADLGAVAGGSVTAGVSGDPIDGEVVVFAVYYPAAGPLAEQYADQLAGRIVIDIANPLNETYDDLATPLGTSAAEELAQRLPGAKVVKAFNTTFAGPLASGGVANQALDVFLAGDDEDAKATVAQLVSGSGLRPIDVGPLRRARQLEGLGLLHITLQFTQGTEFGSAISLIT